MKKENYFGAFELKKIEADTLWFQTWTHWNNVSKQLQGFNCTVKNPVAELPGLPIFSVIFTRRLVRGFPTYQTLLEIM